MSASVQIDPVCFHCGQLAKYEHTKCQIQNRFFCEIVYRIIHEGGHLCKCGGIIEKNEIKQIHPNEDEISAGDISPNEKKGVCCLISLSVLFLIGMIVMLILFEK